MSTGLLRKGGWVAAGVLIVVAGVYSLRTSLTSRPWLPISSSVVAAPVGDIPNIPEKQEPMSYSLDGCPPHGEGGDPELNLLKNRTDPGNYVNVSFDSLTDLTWPKNIEHSAMADWSVSSRSYVEQYAGTPIAVEGYLANVREGPPDPATCNRTASSYLDWHLAFTKGPKDDRLLSVLAEVTPRMRLKHRWTFDTIHDLLVGQHVPVRLSGWLYFDPEHPGDLGVTRVTLWEINPVMQIEVLDKNRWVPLDSIER